MVVKDKQWNRFLSTSERSCVHRKTVIKWAYTCANESDLIGTTSDKEEQPSSETLQEQVRTFENEVTCEIFIKEKELSLYL